MKMDRVITGILCALVGPLVVGTFAVAVAQQAPAAKPNELVVGKLIYVASMPNGLDQWIIDDLRRWGKYKVTSNAEGVDLIIQAVDPQKELRLETRAGTAQPKGADRPHLPHPRGRGDELPPLSISITDWVTSQTIWQANILDRKPKKDEAAPAGALTEIYAHSLTSDQLAQKVVEKLREYEEGLEKSAPGKN